MISKIIKVKVTALQTRHVACWYIWQVLQGLATSIWTIQHVRPGRPQQGQGPHR